MMAGSGCGCIHSVQVDCMAPSNKGRCQLWGATKVQVDVAGKHILPGVALGDCLSPWHLCDRTLGHQKPLVAKDYCHREGGPAELLGPEMDQAQGVVTSCRWAL